jgi:hypothetical protein
MIRHLQKRHNLLKEVTTKEINKNSTLHPYIKIKKEDEEQKIAEETVARMMIRNNSSNLLVECPEMKAMFALIYLNTLNFVNFRLWGPTSPAVPSTISRETNQDSISRIESQLASYKAINLPPIDSDIFIWWRENANKFPDLAKLAQIFLGIPATSISSERLFSKAGILYANTLRNRY